MKAGDPQYNIVVQKMILPIGRPQECAAKQIGISGQRCSQAQLCSRLATTLVAYFSIIIFQYFHFFLFPFSAVTFSH